MKQLINIFCLLFFVNCLQAQDSLKNDSKTEKKITNEIGIKIFHYSQYKGVFPYVNTPKFLSTFDTWKNNKRGRFDFPYIPPSPINGISYKHYYNRKNAVRINFDYYDYYYEDGIDIQQNFYGGSGEYLLDMLSLGYEHNFFKRNSFSACYFIDLSYLFIYNDETYYYNPYESIEYGALSGGIGFSSGINVKYSILKKLFFALETNSQLLYYNSFYMDVERQRNKMKPEGLMFILNPISLSLNYNFLKYD